MRVISTNDVDDIALGASVLGAGGGGNVETGILLLKNAICVYGDVLLKSLDELQESDFIVPLGEMGAPVVGLEKFGQLDAPKLVVEFLCEKMGLKATAVSAVEVGGSNSMVPMVAAASLGIPMIDADSMGRAFPETQMTSFHLNGLVASPLALMDERGNRVMVEAVDTFWAEKIARTTTSLMGARSCVATFGMDGKTAKRCCIGGTISLSQRIGAVLSKARAGEERLESLTTLVNGVIMFKGKITDVNRHTVGGFNKGDVLMQGSDQFSRDSCKITFQNENLVCRVGSRVLATVPDIITVLNSETLVPITTEELRYGQRVAVIGIPAAPIWRTKMGIEVAGPRYFGYDLNYVPVEVLAKRQGNS
ncbi:MAG TPA: DUF917 domain-containing protein [Nitrososphaerales archaeon]|nr:DUF917 domain-containing protein [Nitrososphaerales archaeon]